MVARLTSSLLVEPQPAVQLAGLSSAVLQRLMVHGENSRVVGCRLQLRLSLVQSLLRVVLGRVQPQLGGAHEGLLAVLTAVQLLIAGVVVTSRPRFGFSRTDVDVVVVVAFVEICH